MSCLCLSRVQRTRPLQWLISCSRPNCNNYVTTTGMSCQRTFMNVKEVNRTLNDIRIHHRLMGNSWRNNLRFISTARCLNTMVNPVFRRLSSHNKTPSILYRMLSGRQQYQKNMSERHKTVAMYALSLAILIGGGSYAAVPLYRLYCQASGYGGTVKVADIGEKIENMEKQKHRVIKVKFNADKGATMRWNFKPQQNEIKIVPGETALAFYTAKNPTNVAISGISTYNVIPYEAGQYFNKIQCFCFEEQRLNPGEEVDMPVFFYIDPEFVEDPSLTKVNEITLSYTFFEAKEMSWPELQKYKDYVEKK